MWNVERATPGSPIWPCTRWGFPCLRACAWSGGLLPHLFTLTTSRLGGTGGMFSVALSVGRPRGLASRVYPRPNRGYAASRPSVFGLSSSPNCFGKAILRPSKITPNLAASAPARKSRHRGSVLDCRPPVPRTLSGLPLWISRPSRAKDSSASVHPTTLNSVFLGDLRIGNWDFSGAWSLAFGAFSTQSTTAKSISRV